MSHNIKIGRIYFGKEVDGGRKQWEHVASLFNGRFPNKFDVSFARPPSNGQKGPWSKGTDIRYSDGFVLNINGVYVTLSLEDGYRIVGPGIADEEAQAPFSPQQSTDNIPF